MPKYHIFSLQTKICLMLLICFSLSGCGYQLAADRPSIIGDGTKTLKVKEVDYPTLDPWLPNALRSALRDEINARRIARWVDSGQADYEITINVLSYRSTEQTRGYHDETLLFDTTMQLQAIVYDGRTNKEVWRSSTLSDYSRESTPQTRRESSEIIQLIMRKLADELRHTF